MIVVPEVNLVLVLRETAVLALYPVVPLVVFAALGRRTYLWKWCVGTYVGTMLLGIGAMLIWYHGLNASAGASPAGSATDLFLLFLVTLWLPALLVTGILLLVLKLRGRMYATPLAMLVMTGYFSVVGAVWTVFMFYEALG